MLKRGKRKLEVVTDQEEQQNIVRRTHNELVALGGNQGWNALCENLSTRYYWPRITVDVKKYIKARAVECQLNGQVSRFKKGKQNQKDKNVQSLCLSNVAWVCACVLVNVHTH